MLLHLAPPVSQDLSVAGKRAGLKHEANGDDETTRSGLFMEAVRIIKEMREATNGEYPTFALWENVPGAFSSNNGEDFRTVLQELIKIVEPTAVMPSVPSNGWAYADSYCGDGWSLAYRVFDAQYWGVPQRRRRIYLVLDLRGQRAGEVLFEREGVRGNFATGRTAGKGVAGDAADRTGADDRKEYVYGIDHVITTGGNCTAQGSCVYENIQATLKASGVHAVAYICENAQDRTGADDCDRKCVAYSFDSLASNSMKSKNPYSGCRRVEIAKTLDTTDPNPSKNQGGIAVVCVKCYDARENGDGQTVNTLTGDHENRITDYTSVVCMAHGQANAEILEDKSPCLNCNHEQPIVFDKEVYGTYQNTGIGWWNESPVGATVRTPCGGDSTLANVCVEKNNTRYIVRRLTPTECARLQGFPDDWAHPDNKEGFTDEEYRFWLNVRNTHASINGKQQKDYTKAQMLTWYKKLHTDSSEYKMYGNGIALPCALYVMQGIADALRNEMP